MTPQQLASLARQHLIAKPPHLPPHLLPVAVAISGTDQVGNQRLVRLLEAHGLFAIGSYEPGHGYGVFVAVCDAAVASAVLATFAGRAP